MINKKEDSREEFERTAIFGRKLKYSTNTQMTMELIVFHTILGFFLFVFDLGSGMDRDNRHGRHNSSGWKSLSICLISSPLHKEIDGNIPHKHDNHIRYSNTYKSIPCSIDVNGSAQQGIPTTSILQTHEHILTHNHQ